ncbi:MAG: GGDEF domain-containing protein [Terracidiphilus sp.]
MDPLTGVYDRTTLLAMLFRETDRAQRMKTSLCLLLVGVAVAPDAFPYPSPPIYHDLLRQTASRLTRQLRSYDLLGRIAECAFLAVLPGCDALDAFSLAERVDREVFGKQFIVGCNSIHVTARFGVALSAGRSPIVVLREAEEAMRQAEERESSPASNAERQCATDSTSESAAFATPRNS